MYLGIDLGTSNSAIVGYSDGKLRLFKTPEGADVLPSAVMIMRGGGFTVGRRAYEHAAFSPENVVQGFKRLMGSSSTLSFGAAKFSMTPEMASTEILKSLMAQAIMEIGDFAIDGAVITIPAAFNQMQTEATMRAAKAAGIDKVALLQEPIAAALTSISKSNLKSGQFLVFDLGGGTFDVAIVQSISGAATVVAHAGINMLGGRDFDRAILNAIVRPWLLAQFDLPDNFQADAIFQRLLRVAQHHCEIAKIALSTAETDRVFVDESQIATKDRSGADVFIDVEVTRAKLEDLIAHDIARAIDLCRTLMRENGYRPDDIDRVVMIGGPSRMPVIRSAVTDQLGIRIDTDVDPMTAVATGAAIFCEGREWTDSGAKAAKSARGSSVSNGPVDIQYDYPKRTSDDRIRIRVKAPSLAVEAGYRVVVDTEEGWTSGQHPCEEKFEIRDVPLGRIGENSLRISVIDGSGAVVPEAETRASVTRTFAAAAGMPLTHAIAAKIVRNAAGIEKNDLSVFVKKGTPLPASGSERFRAARDLRAFDGTSLDIELLEQAEGVEDVELNLPIGVFRIDSSDLEKGEVIRKGDGIFIYWTIDASGLLTCEIEIPDVSKRYTTGKMYVPSHNHRNFSGSDGAILAGEMVSAAEADVLQLEKAIGPSVVRDVAALQERIERQREALRIAHDAEQRRLISEEGRFIRQEASRIRSRPENVKASLRADIDGFVETFSTTLGASCDPKVNTQIHRLAGLARDALLKDDRAGLEDARRSLDEMRALFVSEAAKQPEFWIGMFEDLANDRHHAIDKEKHDKLAADGERYINSNDFAGIRDVVISLNRNMVERTNGRISDALAGLMK